MQHYQKNNTQENLSYASDNNKIAQIYHRMLMGDKSALSSLQKINLFPPSKSKIIKQNQIEILTERGIKPITHQAQSQTLQPSPSQNKQKNKNIFPNQKNKNTEQIDNKKQPINIFPAQKLKQMDKFRKYIKEKVNQLRNQRSSLNKQETKQMNNKSGQVFEKSNNLQSEKKHISIDIKKVKPHQFNQSKSFDLSNRKPDKIKPTKNVITIETQSKNIRIRKTPKQNSRQNGKNILTQKLPNLKKPHNTKIITQNSTQNDHQKSNYFSDISQKQFSIPIKITNGKKTFQTGTKQSKFTQKKQEVKPSSKKIQRVKVSLPQMKRQREQLTFLNQQQKQIQMEIFEYHRQTKNFVNSIKEKYNMNFRNQHLMQISKSRVSIESIKQSNVTNSVKQIESNQSKSPPQSKKEIIKAKITECYQQIQTLNKTILQNKSKIENINIKLEKNWFNRYLQRHQNDQIQQQIQNESQPQQQTNFNMGETSYSTVMSQIKQKKYPLKKMIQYDTNRSFQQFSQSRNKSGSRFQSSKKHQYIQNLSKIQQINQIQNEDFKNNKVTVNSRLKNLLFS